MTRLVRWLHQLHTPAKLWLLALLIMGCEDGILDPKFTLSLHEYQRFVDYHTVVDNNSRVIEQLLNEYLQDPERFKTAYKAISSAKKLIAEDGFLSEIKFQFNGDTANYNELKLSGSLLLKSNNLKPSEANSANWVQTDQFALNQYFAFPDARTATRAARAYTLNMELKINKTAEGLKRQFSGVFSCISIDTVQFSGSSETPENKDTLYTYQANISSSSFDKKALLSTLESLQLNDTLKQFKTGKMAYKIADFPSATIQFQNYDGKIHPATIEYLTVSSIIDLGAILTYKNGK